MSRIGSTISLALTSLVAAFRLLSALPVPGHECSRPEDALYTFPLIGALLAGLLGILSLVPLPPLPLAVVLLTGQTLLTRGLHLDGLADSVDGFGGGYTRERTLAIMKDSHIGVFGTLALILACLLKVALLHSLLAAGTATAALVVAMVTARTALVMQCVLWPCARPGGTGSPWIARARTDHLAVALPLCLVLSLPFTGLAHLAVLPAGLGAAWLWGATCRRRVGGMTGDLLGATNELVEITILAGWLLR